MNFNKPSGTEGSKEGSRRLTKFSFCMLVCPWLLFTLFVTLCYPGARDIVGLDDSCYVHLLYVDIAEPKGSSSFI